jgi:hypothetical protein
VFRVAAPAGISQQFGEVVEVSRDLVMVRSVARFVDRERTSEQGFCLAGPSGVAQQDGEVVEIPRDVGMFRPIAL